ncbi:hypothetical protein NEMBOFW57_000729 [Staphylotrichum longicolle]|uniref:EH domain-containing protein n=1 Tax=Staphylotrichum longicolle TaxID=669026 RepID=A0AAD4EZX0_9PEZI|nr:hypothetical protein NEMBOFW57_000729 [Staphylotrichum longicolle]
MGEPSIQITPVEPENDHLDALYNHEERTPKPRSLSQSSASSDDTPLQPQRTAESIISHLTGGSGSKSPSRRTPQQQQPHRTGMLHTLRSPQPSKSDDEDARRRHALHDHHRRRRKVLGGGSSRKHAHHEGARRRWRDEITARERRRYEAVWASNRGLFLRPGWGLQYQDREGLTREEAVERSRAFDGPEAELVVNVVVRDIWSRSRLPADELAEVWDLVDREGKGALGREEFVVGLWLIDQRLRGRKIPARVGRSVWESVAGGGHGVVVPLPGGKKGR